MDIRIGQAYVNATYKYLRPALRLYGPTFVTKFNSFNKLAYGIHDRLFDGAPVQMMRTVYILIDKYVQPGSFEQALNWMKLQEFYITDYNVGSLGSRKHMLVLLFPSEYYPIYDKFIEGKYSEMYMKDELELMFPKPSDEKDVLVKNFRAREKFIQKVFDKFDTVITEEDLKGTGKELDFPPSIKEDTF